MNWLVLKNSMTRMSTPSTEMHVGQSYSNDKFISFSSWLMILQTKLFCSKYNSLALKSSTLSIYTGLISLAITGELITILMVLPSLATDETDGIE